MKLRTRSRSWLSLGVTLVLLTLVAIMGAAAQGPGTAPSGGALAPPGVGPSQAQGFTYQGRLAEGSSPANGNYDFLAYLYTAKTGGSLVAACDNIPSGTLANVPVENGLFTLHLLCGDWNSDVFTGGGRWLELRVRPSGSADPYTILPRQAISPTPYAWSLYPGAVVSNTLTSPDGWVLQVNKQGTTAASAILGTASTGSAVRGESAGGHAIYGKTDDGYAVWGYDAGTTQARGYAGYFYSLNGVGVYGYSNAASYYSNMYAPGVYGKSAHGVGVYGLSEGSGWPGYGGVFDGPVGVSARGTGSAADSGYAGVFVSENYRGLYARSQDGYYAGYFVDRGGSSEPGLYVDGTFVATGGKSGYVVDVCMNEGPDPLETGDVVVITGHDEPLIGEIPLVRVQRATEAESTGVMGVVDQPFTMQAPPEGAASQDVAGLDSAAAEKPVPVPVAAVARAAEGTAVATGEYLSVVTLGSFKAIKVDASYGPIRPGDLLVSSPTPGHAMRAGESPRLGTIIGKALGGLAEGQGAIPVVVTLQ